jgi:mono/diheme cytochrome c family protein
VPVRLALGAPHARLAAAVFAVALAAACDRPPSDADLKDWAPGDHDRVEDNKRIAAGAQPGSQGQGPQSGAQLIEAAWKQQCAICHGLIGKGDGPNAPMFKPADLTREEWQSKVTDDEIVAVIKNGKGKMPKFDAPDAVIAGLVQRIRFYRGK